MSSTRYFTGYEHISVQNQWEYGRTELGDYWKLQLRLQLSRSIEQQWICNGGDKSAPSPDRNCPVFSPISSHCWESLIAGFYVIFSKSICHLKFPFNNVLFHDFIKILFKPCKMGHILDGNNCIRSVFLLRRALKLSSMSFSVKIPHLFNFWKTASFQRFPSNSN